MTSKTSFFQDILVQCYYKRYFAYASVLGKEFVEMSYMVGDLLLTHLLVSASAAEFLRLLNVIILDFVTS